MNSLNTMKERLSKFGVSHGNKMCISLPMLIEMVKYLSEEASGEVSCSGEWVIRAAEEVLQDAYQATEPKE